jgi:hypothetical protein
MMSAMTMSGGCQDLEVKISPKGEGRPIYMIYMLLCAESFPYHSRHFGVVDGNMRDGLAIGDHSSELMLLAQTSHFQYRDCKAN